MDVFIYPGGKAGVPLARLVLGLLGLFAFALAGAGAPPISSPPSP